MIIIQGLIISLQCFIFEYSKKKFLQSLLYLNNAIKLMKATEVALYYTGEFSSKSYNENVRPTLMPPISQPEMSGLNWRDHQFMVKNCMRSIGKLNFTSYPIIQKKYNIFIISLKKAYHAHKYVCGKFVGPASGSLRSNEYSAVQEIEKFKKLRLKILKG
uniref:Catechol hydroxylase n=1 Tax=uncultured organism TaxID=155900 RepID=G8DB25_9ZZZZ|nr:catechol hydroxylase [uncultured organism]